MSRAEQKSEREEPLKGALHKNLTRGAFLAAFWRTTCSALRDTEYSISTKLGRIGRFAMEMERRGRARRIPSLRFLVRPRRVETRTERGFPHFHSNYGYCSLTGLKGQPQQNHGAPQFLVQNLKGEHPSSFFCFNECEPETAIA